MHNGYHIEQSHIDIKAHMSTCCGQLYWILYGAAHSIPWPVSTVFTTHQDGVDKVAKTILILLCIIEANS